jgi:hypothetical protein
MKKLLFVVSEVAPVDKGGIGTFSRNLIKKFAKTFSISFLYCGNASAAALEKEYPEIKFYFIADGGRELMIKTSSQISEILADELDAIFQKENFDYVEFMDWGGWAHQSIMLKRCGKSNIPHSTPIAVRVHSTEHALRKYEYRLLSLRDAETSDFELASLLLADVVICHVASIASLIVAEIKNLFGKDISKKLVVTPMPVYINGKEKSQSIVATPATSIVFSSKTQQIKRPDLFVRGVSAYLERHKEHAGKILFAAHITEDAYARAVFSLIPKTCKNNFITNHSFTQMERDETIATGITVFPAEYESFCFAAYEASLSGAIVVLNERNPAFSDETPWIDGVNCIKFDGSVKGLCAALERAFDLHEPLQSVRANLPEPKILIPKAPENREARPSIDILIYANDLRGIERTLHSLALNSFDAKTSIHLFLTDKAFQTLESNADIASKIGGKVNVVPLGIYPIEAFATCIRTDNSDYLLFMNSGDELSPDILAAFVQSCKFHNMDVFSSRTRNMHPTGFLNRFYGPMPFAGWRCNVIAPPLAFYRTSLIREYFQKARGRSFNFYSMHLHLTMTGAEYVISPRHECISDNPYCEYSIHESSFTEKSAFFRALLFDFLPIPPPTLAMLMSKPVLTQTSAAPTKSLPSFDTYIYRKYIKKIGLLDNILRRFKIVT